MYCTCCAYCTHYSLQVRLAHVLAEGAARVSFADEPPLFSVATPPVRPAAPASVVGDVRALSVVCGDVATPVSEANVRLCLTLRSLHTALVPLRKCFEAMMPPRAAPPRDLPQEQQLDWLLAAHRSMGVVLLDEELLRGVCRVYLLLMAMLAREMRLAQQTDGAQIDELPHAVLHVPAYLFADAVD